MAEGDFNGDGILDLAVANSASNDLTVLLGNGLGGFTATGGKPIALGGSPGSIAVGDFNGDGKLDLAVAIFVTANGQNYGNTVTVLLGNGLGGFTATAASPVVGYGPGSIAVGDFNGDGNLDLAVANTEEYTVTVLLGNGSGGFTAAPGSPIQLNGNPLSIAAGDFNGNGMLDLVVEAVPAPPYNTSYEVILLVADGLGRFQLGALELQLGGGYSTFASVAVGDFNGDGKLDLATADPSGNLTVMLGNGSGGFSGSTFTLGGFPSSIIAGDFNGDGALDLAATNDVNSAGANGNTVTLVLGQVQTTTAVSSSANPSTYGNSVTFTATVTPPAATGTVQFVVDGSSFGSAVTVSGGTAASGATTALSAGTHTVAANFTGSGNYASGSGTLNGFQVNPVSVTITASSATVAYGSGVPAISPGYSGFVNGETSSVLTAQPTCTTTYTVGSGAGSSQSTSCSGAAAADYTFTYGNGTVTVQQKSVTPSITAAGKAYDGTTTATVTCALSGVVLNDAVTCSAATANFVLAAPGTGITVTATGITLSGTQAANYALSTTTASTTASITQAEPGLPAPTTGTATTYGTQTTLTVTVGEEGSEAVPTGSVTFQFTGPNNPTEYVCASGAVQTTACSAPLVNGTATVTTSGLPPGTDSVMATYSGDTNYAGGATSITVSVSQANSTTTVTITPNSSVAYGSAVTLAATVSDATQNSSATPTGSVQFEYSANGTTWNNLGAAVTLNAGAAALLTAALPAGTPVVKAVYSGDADFQPSSVSVQQAVAPVVVTVGGVTAQNKVYDGTTTATVSSSGAALVGILSGDAVTLSGTATGTFSDPNVGNGKTVTVSGLTLSGPAASNYMLTQPTATANITTAAGTVTLGNLIATYTGSQISATATTTPTGLIVVFTYNGSSTAPATAGSYTVVGTIDDPNYAGSATVTLVISKVTPVVTWQQPGAITYGGALSSVQLNATTNVPGSFVYNPPAGTVLPVGNGQTLSVTFTPSDTTDYNSASGSTAINVNPASSSGSPADLVVTNALTRTGSNVVVQITIANTGGTAAANVVLTSVKVGADTATPLPQTIGTIGAGGSAKATVSVPGTVGASGAASSLTLSGTYTGGTFSSSARITLP